MVVSIPPFGTKETFHTQHSATVVDKADFRGAVVEFESSLLGARVVRSRRRVALGVAAVLVADLRADEAARGRAKLAVEVVEVLVVGVARPGWVRREVDGVVVGLLAVVRGDVLRVRVAQFSPLLE